MQLKDLSTKVWQEPIYFIAFGFGSGLMPIAPGTWGTLAALPVYLIYATLSPSIYLIITLGLFLLGIFLCNKVSHQLNCPDYPAIVWDEIVGYLLTMFAIPFSWKWMVAGFFLFRLFDIWKPSPIRLVDKYIQGGLGIMLDDVLAALPAWVILQSFVWILYYE